jgi:hypothetical protein
MGDAHLLWDDLNSKVRVTVDYFSLHPLTFFSLQIESVLTAVYQFPLHDQLKVANHVKTTISSCIIQIRKR